IERAREKLGEKEAALMQARLRLNGDSELSRRQLQSEREQLRQEKDVLRLQSQEQDNRATDLQTAKHSLLEEQRKWETERAQLAAECQGLENRIKNHRRN